MELLEYWILEDKKQEIVNEKERSKVWVDHLSRKYTAQMTMINKENEKDIKKQLEEFEDMINPYANEGEPPKSKTKSYAWPDDDEFQKQLELQKRGGG